MSQQEKQSDWVSFFSGMVKPGRLSAFVGVTFIIILSVVIIFLGSWRADYAEQFYPLTFKVNFLEGLTPKMKVRYQGGPVVGEIDYIESLTHEHFLHARIRKDFKIIKKGTSITIRSFGIMGQSYIDISSYAINFNNEAYEPGDVVSLEDITPDQVLLMEISNALKKEYSSGLTPLDRKLKDIQSMVSYLRKNDYFNPKKMKSSMDLITSKLYRSLDTLRIFSLNLYNQVYAMNEVLTVTAENLRRSVPKVVRRVGATKDVFYYSGNSSDYNFLHDEFTYDTILMEIKIINDKLEQFKEEPHKIIYD